MPDMTQSSDGGSNDDGTVSVLSNAIQKGTVVSMYMHYNIVYYVLCTVKYIDFYACRSLCNNIFILRSKNFFSH